MNVGARAANGEVLLFLHADVTLPGDAVRWISVSGRRFLARSVFYTAVMDLFPLLYRLGVPPRTLAALHGHVR